MPYLWFHAFNRDDVAAVVKVLRDGAVPPPAAGPMGAGTRHSEGELGIVPGCVYAYLGQTLEAFGDCAVSLKQTALNGTGNISPFDTGGLVGHHVPVKDWAQADRRAYLKHFSWSAVDLEARLANYPSDDPAAVEAYLLGAKPQAAGPHEAFPGDNADLSRVASIWLNSTDVRSWLWEGRVAHLQVAPSLVRWSCSPALHGKILQYCEGVVDPIEGAWLAQVMPLFVEGGVAELIRELVDFQKAAA